MPIRFERDVCRNLDETISREWLITNGLGGYAAGTAAGVLTRMQHGLLIASLPSEIAPQLLLAKIDEEVLFDQRTYYLGTNEYQDGTLNPAGFVHLETFRLEDGFPVFTYRLGGLDGIMLEKRIWMSQGENTTYIQYRTRRTAAPTQDTTQTSSRRSNSGRSYNNYLTSNQPSLTLTLLPFTTYRPYNQPRYGHNNEHFQVQSYQSPDRPEEVGDGQILSDGMAGCTISVWNQETPYHILAVAHPSSQVNFIPTGVWYWHFLRRHERAANLPESDDLYLPGVIRAKLWLNRDAELTIIVSTEELHSQLLNQKQLHQAYDQARNYHRGLLATQSYFGEGGRSVQTLPVLPFTETSSASSSIGNEEFLQLLHQASDRFLGRRPLSEKDGTGSPSFFFRSSERTIDVTSGYYDINEDMRKTLIALPGLTVATRRFSEAQHTLRYTARYFRQGLLPDHLPGAHHPQLQDTDYNNADITLWYFHAMDKYLSATGDYELLDEIYLRLVDSLTYYRRGTTHGIQVDPRDGLLKTGSSEEQTLTWMNARHHGKPVTPRTGKAVELNALWYNALALMHKWSLILYQNGRINYNVNQYEEASELCKKSFNELFYYWEGKYLYDVIEGPAGNDRSLRPNQLLAISLSHAVLEPEKQIAILDTITQQLVTPYGLRTLAPDDPAYQGRLPENHVEQSLVLHQGSVWPWLVGPYIDALIRIGNQRAGSERPYRNSSSDFYRDRAWHQGLETLEPFRQHMQYEMLGTIGEVYSGDLPHTSGSQIASAISIGEILRAYRALAHMGVQYSGQAIPA